MRTRRQKNSITNNSDTLEPTQGVAQLLVRLVVITQVWLGASAHADAFANSLAKARDTRGGLVTSIARHKFDAASMMQVLILWTRKYLCLDGAETVQNDPCGRPHIRVHGNALDRELSKFRRTARIRKTAHFFRIDGK